MNNPTDRTIKIMETIRGDGLSKKEMKQRKIKMVEGTRGGVELHAPTYERTIVAVLNKRGFLEEKEIAAACDYLELKNSVYGFLNAKTITGILHTGDATPKRSHAEAAYYVAARYIGKVHEKNIITAMNDEADDTLNMIMVVDAFRTAFRAVCDGMDLAKEKIREEMEKELEHVY